MTARTREAIDDHRVKGEKIIREAIQKNLVNASSYLFLTELNDALASRVASLVAAMERQGAQQTALPLKKLETHEEKIKQARQIIQDALTNEALLEELRAHTLELAKKHFSESYTVPEPDFSINKIYEKGAHAASKRALLLQRYLAEFPKQNLPRYNQLLTELMNNILAAKRKAELGEQLSDAEEELLELENEAETYLKDPQHFQAKTEKFLLMLNSAATASRIAEGVLAWSTENLHYVEDPYDADYFQRPNLTLQSKRGDCDCLSILIASMLKSIGFKVYIGYLPLDHPTHWFPGVYLRRIRLNEGGIEVTEAEPISLDPLFSKGQQPQSVIENPSILDKLYTNHFGVGLRDSGRFDI